MAELSRQRRRYHLRSGKRLVRPVFVEKQPTGLELLRARDEAITTDSMYVARRIRGTIKGIVFQGTSAAQANAGLPQDPNRQIRTEPPREDANTPSQQLQRGYLRRAVVQWQSFTELEKAEYTLLARQNKKSHPEWPNRTWDNRYTYFLHFYINFLKGTPTIRKYDRKKRQRQLER